MSTTGALQERSSETTSIETQKVVSQVSAMAMVNEEFRNRLIANPKEVLVEQGMEFSSDMDLKIQICQSFEEVPDERPRNTMYLVIPQAEELSQEDLSIGVSAANSCQSTASTCCTTPSCLSSSSSASTECA
ncbi:hypothetical protein [Coleofasciculus sp.]|uniref:hypothetical protein n=1 Tax=Coleofasciculus sp. TaxID=3100458 RepID=UPI0039F824C9